MMMNEIHKLNALLYQQIVYDYLCFRAFIEWMETGKKDHT